MDLYAKNEEIPPIGSSPNSKKPPVTISYPF